MKSKFLKKTALFLERLDIDVNEKSFIYSGNMPNEEKTALHLAAEIGDLGILMLLLKKKGIDINIKDSQGKKAIDYSKNLKVIQLLSQ
ncbi:hypothetical protein M9Y10_019070 [Tritrichomonas musculus]|uniref:Ankyrin repeat protein n=1 Tax=Tritrichomonas musculus TaxID=1915356 RepID=A0ABR2HIH1_9EUKA